MKVLVVNCGSSSLKYQLIDMDDNKVLAKGKISKTFKISAPKFSASAIEKIEEAGGSASGKEEPNSAGNCSCSRGNQ